MAKSFSLVDAIRTWLKSKSLKWEVHGYRPAKASLWGSIGILNSNRGDKCQRDILRIYTDRVEFDIQRCNEFILKAADPYFFDRLSLVLWRLDTRAARRSRVESSFWQGEVQNMRKVVNGRYLRSMQM